MLTRRARTILHRLLHTHDTPHRTALAFAVGVFIGFSPLLGLHTVLGLALAFLLNLNRLAVLAGMCLNLPWILPAYYSVATLAGAAILRTEVPHTALDRLVDGLAAGAWGEALHSAGALSPLLWPYLAGSTLGAAVLAAVAYRAALTVIVASRRRAQASGAEHLRDC